MLASLLSEVRRRHLWPIPLVALLVAVGAPLLFLKPAPSDAPAGAPPAALAAPTGELPTRAGRLLASKDAAKPAARRSGKRGDPFQAPSSHRGSTSTGPAAQNAGSPAAQQPAAVGAPATQPQVSGPVPVVVTNADGTRTATAQQPSADRARSSRPTPKPKAARAVDVRFGTRMPGALHRSIPRLQTFVAGGRVIAIFVKHSPRRHKAVFAIAPNTLVAGDITCRRKNGVCRYVDIPPGRGVRLTTLAADGSLITRRLDVVQTRSASQKRPATAVARRAASDGSCLLGKLLRLSADDAPLAGDACRR